MCLLCRTKTKAVNDITLIELQNLIYWCMALPAHSFKGQKQFLAIFVHN